MTPEEAIKELKKLQSERGEGRDVENDHILADEILCKLVPPEVVNEWKKIIKWYS